MSSRKQTCLALLAKCCLSQWLSWPALGENSCRPYANEWVWPDLTKGLYFTNVYLLGVLMWFYIHCSCFIWDYTMPPYSAQPPCCRAEISQLSNDVSGWNATELPWNTRAGRNRRTTDCRWSFGMENRCKKTHLESLTKHSSIFSRYI